jgi:hypothetical protein
MRRISRRWVFVALAQQGMVSGREMSSSSARLQTCARAFESRETHASHSRKHARSGATVTERAQGISSESPAESMCLRDRRFLFTNVNMRFHEKSNLLMRNRLP